MKLWKKIGELLAQHEIESTFVTGNIFRRNKALDGFKGSSKDASVILLGLNSAASGSNLIEASHVILLDPVTGTKNEAQAIEAQAIGRAYRQGQKKQVTVVRFMVKDSPEHHQYIQTYGLQHDPSTTDETVPKLLRTSSIAALLTSTPAIQKSGSILGLIEDPMIE